MSQVPMFHDLPKEEPAKLVRTFGVICFREILNELMEERRLSASQISRGSGVAESVLSEYRSGEVKEPNVTNVFKLARYFNVRPDYLVYGIGDDEPYFYEFKEA